MIDRTDPDRRMSGEELKAAHPNTDQGVTADVTQDDRIAAVDIHNVILHDWFTQHMLDGMEDECYVIQAFARHRLSSTAALEGEIASLKQRLESAEEENARLDRILKETHDKLTGWVTEAGPKIRTLEAALNKFGKHDGLCARIGGYGYCNCGLEDALQEQEKQNG